MLLPQREHWWEGTIPPLLGPGIWRGVVCKGICTSWSCFCSSRYLNSKDVYDGVVTPSDCGLVGASTKEVSFSAVWKDSFPCTAINLTAISAPLGLASLTCLLGSCSWLFRVGLWCLTTNSSSQRLMNVSTVPKHNWSLTYRLYCGALYKKAA